MDLIRHLYDLTCFKCLYIILEINSLAVNIITPDVQCYIYLCSYYVIRATLHLMIPKCLM